MKFLFLSIKEIFMAKNVVKISFLAWFVLLLFVFSCGNEVDKRLIKKAEPEKPKTYDYQLCIDAVMKSDTVGYQSCCETNNACWNEVDSLGVRLSFPVIIELGVPKMCRKFVEQKDSIGYYACCKKYSACWVPFYDENDKRTHKQLEYETIQNDTSYYNAANLIKNNFEKSIERVYKKLDGSERESLKRKVKSAMDVKK